MSKIPSIAMIPSGYKASKLYSVLPTDGTGDFTTSRASVATRVNENGLIEEVASNVPRLDYSDGTCPSLLLEPSATNLIVQSEDFSDASWVKLGTGTGTAAVITPNYAISPDGSLNASRLQCLLNGGTTTSDQSSIYALDSSGTSQSISVYMKSNNGSNQVIFLANTVGANDTVTVTSEWQRFEFNHATSNHTFSVGLRGATGSDDTADISIWGAQSESLSYATSYIKTVGTAQTRTADTANGSGNSTVINSTEGVLYFEGSALANDGTNRYISLSDGSTLNRVNIFFDSSNKLRVFYNGISGSISINIDTTINNKIAFKYKSGDSALWVNGTEVATRADSLSLVGLNLLSFDLSGGGGNIFNSKTKSVQVYTTALSDLELTNLTKI
jgi:hypothetical protein